MATDDGYILNRDTMASARLSLQHYALLDLQQWYLPPEIDTHIKSLPAPRIADLATGNAIWATGLLDRHPTAQITGLDISAAQFPPSSSLPSNITLAVHDLFAPVPETYLSAFDLIHLRLTVGWIHDRDGPLLLKNVLSMLRPGGYIQWEENTGPDAEHATDVCYIVNPDFTYKPGFPEWCGPLLSKSLLAGFAWLRTLPELFRERGMEGVRTYRPEPRRSLLQTHTQCLRWTIAEIYGTMVQAGVPGSRESYEKDMKGFDGDVARGMSFVYGWTVAVGRRPL